MTYVYDATDIVMGRLASKIASQLLKSHQSGNKDKVIIINVENAIISGRKDRIINDFKAKYELNHATEYKHIIINDSFDKAADELFNIIAQKRSLNQTNNEEVQQFLAQLLSY